MNRIANDFTIVCYDISSNKLRRRIDKAMKDFGLRLQYSVFLCRLDAEGVNRCRDKLNDIFIQFSNQMGSNDSLVIIERVNGDRIGYIIGDKMESDRMNFRIY